MKRILYLVFFALAMCLNANAAVDISSAETKALNSISSSLPSEYVLYRYSSAVNSVTMAVGAKMSLGSKCWVFFLDEQPNASWGHKCRYIFVSQSTGNVTIKEASMYPKDIKNWTKRKSATKTVNRQNAPKSNGSGSLFGSDNLIRTNLFTNFPSKEVQSTGTKYAVIISGGGDEWSNYPRYWNDCSLIYQILTRLYKYSPANIYTYMADGTDPGLDICGSISSPLDLDGNGTTDINGPATISALQSCFTSLKNRITENDELFIFTTDHGDTTGYSSGYMVLWNNVMLKPSKLKSMLTGIKCPINITMEQCFSGCFIYPLETTGQKITIATAAHRREPSWAAGAMYYLLNDFSYQWSCAVAGYDVFNEQSVNADSNNDGMVSMEEAFIYANAHDVSAYYGSEQPQYWSYGGISYGSSTIDFHTISNYMSQKVGKMGQYQFLGETYGCDYSMSEQVDLSGSLSNTTKSYTSGWVLNSTQVINSSTVNYTSKNKVSLKSGFKYTKGSGSRSFHAIINPCESLRSGEFIEDEDASVEESDQPVVYYINTEIEEADGLLLFPNPTDGAFTVAFASEDVDYTLSVTDVAGKVIYTTSGTGREQLVNLEGKASGVYFVRVTVSDRSYVEKVIVK